MSSNEHLFTHLSLGKVLSRTFSLFVDRIDVFMTLSAVVLVPATIFSVLIAVVVGMEVFVAGKMSPNDPDKQVQDMIDFLLNHIFVVFAVILLHVIISMVTTLVGEGAMVRATADMYAAQTQGWLTCAKLGMHHFCALLGASVLVGATLYGGLLVVVLIIWLGVKTSSGFLGFVGFIAAISYLAVAIFIFSSVMMIFPVVMIENKGPIIAIRRSIEISEGRRCYIFCAILILFVIRSIVAQLLQNIFTSDNPLASFFSAGGIIVAFLPDLLFLPLTSIMKTVLYTSIRVDKEGLTQDILQRQLVAPVAYSPPNTDYRQVSLMEEDGQVTGAPIDDFA